MISSICIGSSDAGCIWLCYCDWIFQFVPKMKKRLEHSLMLWWQLGFNKTSWYCTTLLNTSARNLRKIQFSLTLGNPCKMNSIQPKYCSLSKDGQKCGEHSRISNWNYVRNKLEDYLQAWLAWMSYWHMLLSNWCQAPLPSTLAHIILSRVIYDKIPLHHSSRWQPTRSF